MMSNEINKFVPPDHLNEKFLKRSLENGFQISGINIVDFQITLGTQPGDNYTSTIYRVKVIYKEPNSGNKEVFLIVKSILVDEHRASLEEFGMLDKEFNVYIEILPKISKILGDSSMAPKCFNIVREPHRNIVFQDMKALGYKVASRQTGLDEPHFQVALDKIAKFHAASIKLLKEDPTIEKDFRDGILTEQSVVDPMFQTVFRENIPLVAEVLNTMPGYERFYPKLMKIYDNYREIALKMVEPDPENDIKVLNHGDLWVNNFLFKYDEKTQQPTDIVFVDYQGTFFNSLGIDLNYLFATSAQVDVLKRKMELIEKYYYPVFIETLKNLEIESIPTLQDIINQVKQREIYNLICLFAALPLLTLSQEDSKTNDFSQFADKEKARQKTLIGMATKRFSESMKYTVKYLENKIDETISKY
ncbi:uncharacterized protein LOC119657857 isoform X2 [Hermetia illucens]|uniref:uncharacterized protein LOC119657857 isoform X2 n=1 Tax=Hermetia illucens TaxID=343691 RepID=UPI0018CC1E55|nr:uncharacterized protein LOC119657857 isoform X2 [Hermetia illucens]